MEEDRLAKEQLRYIEKVIIETNNYDNVTYEFIDEPTLFLTPSRKVYEWINILIEKAVGVEDKHPKRHMFAQQLEIGADFCSDERVALVVSQYINISARRICLTSR